MLVSFLVFFFFKQKTAYELRISDWSSDVCSSDLLLRGRDGDGGRVLLAWDGAGNGHRDHRGRRQSVLLSKSSAADPPLTGRSFADNKEIRYANYHSLSEHIGRRRLAGQDQERRRGAVPGPCRRAKGNESVA